MKKSLFWLLALVLSPVAVLVVITPMDSQKQYIFGLLSIGILFLMGLQRIGHYGRHVAADVYPLHVFSSHADPALQLSY
ncbi:hypothetical protein WP3S18C02_02190 [Klebsiella quasipneumoniae]|nr:hypothetical protein WP3S18C02_02190 [Klebsiella quasipneumoniae]